MKRRFSHPPFIRPIRLVTLQNGFGFAKRTGFIFPSPFTQPIAFLYVTILFANMPIRFVSQKHMFSRFSLSVIALATADFPVVARASRPCADSCPLPPQKPQQRIQSNNPYPRLYHYRNSMSRRKRGAALVARRASLEGLILLDFIGLPCSTRFPLERQRG
jgi:hypothetical protein